MLRSSSLLTAVMGTVGRVMAARSHPVLILGLRQGAAGRIMTWARAFILCSEATHVENPPSELRAASKVVL
jgi:hypothetical protein